MILAVVRTQVEGFHQWPNAPRARAYLGHRHRHLFHIEAAVEVRMEDREIEFHDLRATLRGILDAEPVDFGGMSCESIATAVGSELRARLALPDDRHVQVGVFEDGECGAVVS